MKAERLMGILTLLLNRRKLSASYLARHFEVSVRTIYRDVDDLSVSGIPVFATAGRDGGFELMEGFTIDKQVLETSDIRRILTGLESINTILPGPANSLTVEKYKLLLRQSEKKGISSKGTHIFIELSPSNREKKVIEILNSSIEDNKAVSMEYSDTESKQTRRTIEPKALVFIWQAWYVYAWCQLRKAFRLFRVSRIKSPEVSAAKCSSPPADIENRPWNKVWEMEENYRVTFIVQPKAKARVYELFFEENIQENDDKTLTVTTELPMNDWSLSFLLAIPGGITIISPLELREMLKNLVLDVFQKNTDIGCQD